MHDFWMIISLWLIAIAIFVLPYSLDFDGTVNNNIAMTPPPIVMMIPSLPVPEVISERVIPQPDFILPDQGGNLASLIYDQVNAERVNRGLDALEWDDNLAQAGTLHAQDMADNNYVSHVDKTGKGPSDRAMCYNEEYQTDYTPAENIVQLSTHKGLDDSAADALNAWLQSPPHAKTIKIPNWTYTGIGVAINNNGIAYVVQMFC